MGIAEDTYAKYICVCEVCGKKGSLRCSRCRETYCSRECQLKAWPGHKKLCKMSLHQQVNKALSRFKPSEAEARPSESCWVCLEDGEGVYWGGCGCRHGGMCGHIPCFVKAAAETSCDPSRFSSMPLYSVNQSLWRRCSLCKQEWSGKVAYELVREMCRSEPMNEVRMQAAEAVLFQVAEDFETALGFMKRRLEMMRTPALIDDTNTIYTLGNYAGALMLMSDLDRAIGIHGDCLKWRVGEWEQGRVSLTEVIINAGRYAQTLLYAVRLPQYQDRLQSFAQQAVDALKNAVHLPEGETKARSLLFYAEALARSDRLDEALTVVEKPLAYYKRVFGEDNFSTEGCRSIRDCIIRCRDHLKADDPERLFRLNGDMTLSRYNLPRGGD